MADSIDVYIALLNEGEYGRPSDLSSDLVELQSWVDAQASDASILDGKVEGDPASDTGQTSPVQPDLDADLRRMADGFERSMAAYQSVIIMADAMRAVLPRHMLEMDVRKPLESSKALIEARGKYNIYKIPKGMVNDIIDSIVKIGGYSKGAAELNTALLLSWLRVTILL